MSEIILSIAGEGGSVTIVGRRTTGGSGWEFARQTVDHTMAMLGTGPGEEGEPDPDYRPPQLQWVGSWSEAIGLIDRYPWALLFPLKVHLEFKAEVLVEVTHRLTSDHPKYAGSPTSSKNRAMERWLEKCR